MSSCMYSAQGSLDCQQDGSAHSARTLGGEEREHFFYANEAARFYFQCASNKRRGQGQPYDVGTYEASRDARIKNLSSYQVHKGYMLTLNHNNAVIKPLTVKGPAINNCLPWYWNDQVKSAVVQRAS